MAAGASARARSGRAGYLTFHDSHTRTLLKPRSTPTRRWPDCQTPALFDGEFALLASDRWPEYGGTQVFYSDAHLRATLTSMFTICSMTREAYGYQTAVIVTTLRGTALAQVLSRSKRKRPPRHRQIDPPRATTA